jgi:hypothetical protein
MATVLIGLPLAACGGSSGKGPVTHRLLRTHRWDEKVIRRLTERGSKRPKKRAGR